MDGHDRPYREAATGPALDGAGPTPNPHHAARGPEPAGLFTDLAGAAPGDDPAAGAPTEDLAGAPVDPAAGAAGAAVRVGAALDAVPDAPPFAGAAEAAPPFAGDPDPTADAAGAAVRVGAALDARTAADDPAAGAASDPDISGGTLRLAAFRRRWSTSRARPSRYTDPIPPVSRLASRSSSATDVAPTASASSRSRPAVSGATTRDARGADPDAADPAGAGPSRGGDPAHRTRPQRQPPSRLRHPHRRRTAVDRRVRRRTRPTPPPPASRWAARSERPGSTSAFLDDAPPDAPPPVPPAPPDPAWQTLIDAISAAGRLAAHLKAGNARCKLIEALNEARRAALKHTTQHPAARA